MRGAHHVAMSSTLPRVVSLALVAVALLSPACDGLGRVLGPAGAAPSRVPPSVAWPPGSYKVPTPVSSTTPAVAAPAPTVTPEPTPMVPTAPTAGGDVRCHPPSTPVRTDHVVSDEAVLAMLPAALPGLAARCASSGAPVSADAILAAARTCLAQSSSATTRFDVCANGACCGMGLATLDVPQRTDAFGRWVIVRGPTQIDDYEDEVLWSDHERTVSTCSWAPYASPACWGEGARDPEATGCDMTPVQWEEVGADVRAFLCETGL